MFEATANAHMDLPVIEMLSMSARGSIPIRTDDSIRVGYYPRTGKILPLGLWQKASHS